MSRERVKVVVRGAVQGVGFRPFVYRLASELQLTGWVLNSPQGVLIEAEGEPLRLETFLSRLKKEKPPLAILQSLDSSFVAAAGYKHFDIRESEEDGPKRTLVLPDMAPCPDCLREIFDPQNRRYLYPFTNCTNCGPRFSIIESLPYDRPNTSMKKFALCDDCQREYRDPADRRFHAQPNACAVCGPHVELWGTDGKTLALHRPALHQAALAIRAGQILALKGVGGFQLLVDARDDEAVRRLRERKHRPEKPFALMYPSLASVKADCGVSDLEERRLQSPEAPIVLLEQLDRTHAQSARDFPALAASIAPGNPNLGVMLPGSPLHHLLLRELNFPVVATSGNLSDEPICTDEHEALERLHDVADVFLVHDRPIVRPVDDSIARVMGGREMILRRARGYAPLPVRMASEEAPEATILAVGAHLKNSVALSVGDSIFISQHIGDLETPQALEAFRAIAKDLPRLYETTPGIIACDLHPEYLSTKHAKVSGARLIRVQHHHAHIESCMGEHSLEPPVLGVSWDGTGYGTDGTIWGGEFLIIDEAAGNTLTPFTRFAHFRNFRLPGGDAAIRQPSRIALGLLWEILRDPLFERDDLFPLQQFSATERANIRLMLARGVNAPATCSAGRLFDAVASILGARQRISFEGQSAMELEFRAKKFITNHSYKIKLMRVDGPKTNPAAMILDWEPMISEMLEEIRQHEPIASMAAKFHNTLVQTIVEIAQLAGQPQVVLSGGCFQNKRLLEGTVLALRESGFKPFWHQRVPTNDGGIALGQVMVARRQLRLEAAMAAHKAHSPYDASRLVDA